MPNTRLIGIGCSATSIATSALIVCNKYRHALQIDHYVPQTHDPARTHDPDNLLLSCPTCGRQKSDYHPAHEGRRRRSTDQSGFMVLDVRCDDLARMFVVKNDGSLALHPALVDARERQRAAWNVALLRLDLHDWERARLLEKVRLVEELQLAVDAEPTARRLLEIMEGDLAERLPMIRAFEISLSPELSARLQTLTTLTLA